MTIRIVAAGRLKERYWRDASSEYIKRLGRYCKIRIAEVDDEPAGEEISEREKEMVLDKEAGRILRQIPDQSLCIALAIDGKRYSSEAFASFMKERMDHGTSDITLVIGGSLGLSPAVMKRADLSLSFSDFTFPHQLMRVITLEQIYRSFRIINHEPYHK